MTLGKSIRNVYAVNMTINANSVNIKKSQAAKSSYHHGDLREAALQGGLDILAESEGYDDLGLRALARKIGVSATALYRHFPDKEALLSAVANEGMERLGTIQREASQAAGGGREGFAAKGVAYVEFAVANPALFRLVFRQAPSADLLNAELSDVGTAMAGLREHVTDMMPAGMSEKSRKIAALQAWSLVHGLALLIIDRQVEFDPELVRQVVMSERIN